MSVHNFIASETESFQRVVDLFHYIVKSPISSFIETWRFNVFITNKINNKIVREALILK